jgi:N-methylhydantoinase B
MDTGGLFCIPMGRIPDTEMTEYLYPLLTLWRREEPDSGGPGRQRGGVSASMAVTPYGTSVPMGLVLASAGKSVAQNNGMAGGYPGNTGVEVLARGADMITRMARGELPTDLAGVGGAQEYGACYAESYLAPGEVFYLHWQGGGGYGDPLSRDPAAVARDLAEDKVTAAGAEQVYGVVLVDGGVDVEATASRRGALLDERRGRSAAAGPGVQLDLTGARRLDDNLVEARHDGRAVVGCAHCGRLLGDAAADSRLQLVHWDGPSSAAGPQVTSDPAVYVDAPVVFRQLCCPGCWTAISSAIVPADHDDHVLDLSRLLTAAPANG